MQVTRSAIGAALLLVGACLALAWWRPTPIPTASGPAAQALALSRELMSPFCHGLLLSDCPSPNAAILRGEIRARLGAGEAAATIEQDLLSRYGPELKASPDATGTGAIAWLAPVVVAIASVVALVVAVRLLTRSRGTVATMAPADARLLARLDDELDELT